MSLLNSALKVEKKSIHGSLRLFVFDLTDQLLQFVDGERFLFDQGGNDTGIGIIVIFADHLFQGVAAVFVFRYQRVILVRVSIGFVADVSLFFEGTDNRREGGVVGLWLILYFLFLFFCPDDRFLSTRPDRIVLFASFPSWKGPVRKCNYII